MPFISQKDVLLIETEIKQINWSDTIGNMSCGQACTDLMSTVKDILLKYTKIRGNKTNAKNEIYLGLIVISGS